MDNINKHITYTVVENPSRNNPRNPGVFYCYILYLCSESFDRLLFRNIIVKDQPTFKQGNKERICEKR